MSRRSSSRPDYGVDAPGVVRGLWMGGLACVLVGLIFHFAGSFQHYVLMISVFVLGVIVGSIMLIGAIAMWWSSRFGKLIERRHLIGSLDLKAHETVLDIGCGQGLLLTEAAKYLESGKAIGVDLWQSRDQSGNTMGATIANARAENVADRVEVKTGDMRSLPIEDRSVDVVISSLAIHNLPTREDRVRAIEEISRVLKPGGRLALLDLAYSEDHMNTLKRLGWSHVERSGPVFLICPPVRVVRGTKPGGP